MNPPLVYVITLNWNRCEATLECLASLTRLLYPNMRLLAVDNGSTDGSPQAIAARFPQVEQILNPTNRGFAGGFNAGLRRALEAGADFALVLNNDTQAAPDMLEALVAAAGPPDVGIAAPVIFYASTPDKVWSAGAGRSSFTLELTGNHGRAQTLTEVTEREFVSGCAMLIRRAALEQVGLFDERFFMYYEDSDYCLRVRQAGLRLVVVPSARLWHKVSLSSQGSDSPDERYGMGRASSQFYRKHVRGWRWLVVFPWRAGSTVKTALRLIGAGRMESALAYLRGVWEGLKR